MLKYVNTGVVFQEIPDEVTLAINISGCPCHCPGCHSPYLWQDFGEPLTTESIVRFIEEYGDDITCIAFMGGDAEPEYVVKLSQFIRHAFSRYKVAWYSGRIRLPKGIQMSDFDYVKTGPFLRHLGSLRERTTNQRLYRCQKDGTFTDITSRFWKS